VIPGRLPRAPSEGSEKPELRAGVATVCGNHHEVTFPFRVLPSSEVAGVLGYPLPVRPQHSPNAWPCRYSFLCPCPETRLSELSSPGVQLLFTAYLEFPAADISAGGTSLGVPVPFNASGGESPRPSARRLPCSARRPARPPRCYRSVLPAGPTPPATVSLTGFPNLAATSSSLRRPAIFRRVALVGFTLQGVVPRMKPRRLVAAELPS